MKEHGKNPIPAQRPWYRSFRVGDILIAALILFLALGLLFLNSRIKHFPADSVVLLSEGRPIRIWTMDDLAKEGQEELEMKGYHYLLKWEEGQICFARADCPDKVCVQSGWVGKRGSIAACIPGGLVLKAQSSGGAWGSDDPDVVIR